jgi:hypothetical protein
VLTPTHGPTLRGCGTSKVIDSELRLLLAIRRIVGEEEGRRRAPRG